MKGSKSCKKCGATTGPRTKVCKSCGHQFQFKSVVEPVKVQPVASEPAPARVNMPSYTKNIVFIPSGTAPVKLKSDDEPDIIEWANGCIKAGRELGSFYTNECLSQWSRREPALSDSQHETVCKVLEENFPSRGPCKPTIPQMLDMSLYFKENNEERGNHEG